MVDSDPFPGKIMVTLRPLQAARQSLAMEALQMLRKENKTAARGSMKTAIRVWDLFFHCTCCPQLTGHAFLWSQGRRTVRATSPISLTSLMRARKGSLWINVSGEAQHKAGVAGGTILAYAKPWGFPILFSAKTGDEKAITWF